MNRYITIFLMLFALIIIMVLYIDLLSSVTYLTGIVGNIFNKDILNAFIANILTIAFIYIIVRWVFRPKCVEGETSNEWKNAFPHWKCGEYAHKTIIIRNIDKNNGMKYKVSVDITTDIGTPMDIAEGGLSTGNIVMLGYGPSDYVSTRVIRMIDDADIIIVQVKSMNDNMPAKYRISYKGSLIPKQEI